MIKPGLLPLLLTGAALAQPANPDRAPSASEQSAALAAIRDYALNYTQRLPDYRCTQVTRWKTSGAQLLWDRKDRTGVVETEIGFVNHRETEKITTINGKRALLADLKDLPQTSSHGEFGTLLARIFDPRSSTELHWSGWDTRDGRRLYVFSYRVPQSSGYILRVNDRSVVVAFSGSVYADFETKAVTRIEMRGVDFPPDSPFLSMELTLNYQLTRVKFSDADEREFMLPSDFKLNSWHWEGSTQIVAGIDAQYKDYRRFGADARIQFGDSGSAGR